MTKGRTRFTRVLPCSLAAHLVFHTILRQDNRERRAMADARIDSNRAAVPFSNLFTDGEAEARAADFTAGRIVDAIKLVEQFRQCRHRNPDACVLNGNLNDV